MITNESVPQLITHYDENKVSYKQRQSELGVNPWSFHGTKCKSAQKEVGGSTKLLYA
ncbi:MAG: hypothetical protein IJQ93_09135 [Bacteroidales bacterium]|nr:hypothetical protein [Bacteroidales bacterium]